MLKRSAVLLALPLIAACSSGSRDEETYRAPVVAPAKAGGPSIQYDVVRTGLEYQVDRGTRVGDVLLGGQIAVQRVTANGSLGVLQADLQVKGASADPVLALYRVIFYDDVGKPVGSAFSEWKPLSLEPYGTANLHATCSQRTAVYFVLEAWKGGAQAKAEVKPVEKK